jgi:hypothetical protein
MSHVQTFFHGNRLTYFPIHTPSLSPSTTNDFSLFKAQFPEADTASNDVVESTNYRQMHQFLEKEGWIAHLSGYAVSNVIALVSLPRLDANILPNLRSLLSNIQAIIANTVFHVRRLLGRRPS